MEDMNIAYALTSMCVFLCVLFMFSVQNVDLYIYIYLYIYIEVWPQKLTLYIFDTLFFVSISG